MKALITFTIVAVLTMGHAVASAQTTNCRPTYGGGYICETWGGGGTTTTTCRPTFGGGMQCDSW